MRALCAIAFVLSVAGSVHAQVPEASVSEASEAVPDEEAPSASADAAEPEASEVDEEEAPVDVAPTPAEPVARPRIEEIDGTTDAQGIERIEGPEVSELDVDEDDLPPALRGERAPLRVPPSAPRVRLSPWRGYGGVSTGLSLHLNPQDGFQQGVIAPAYLHLRGGAVLPGRGALRHALQLGVSTNLSREGAYPSGTLALRQWVVVPSYVMRVGLDASLSDSALPAWLATARVGVPIVVSPDATIGAELAVGAQYFARAGVAVFAELIYDVFVGGRERDGSRSTHHLMTLEVGLQFELEVLP